MKPARVAGRAAAPALLLALAGLLASCAPPLRPAPTVDDMAARYTAERARREACLQALTADLVLRLDGRATGRLPGLSASLALAAPGRARVRVGSLFGTVLDACARGDSVLAWVPSEHTALALAGAAETLGIAPPVELLARSLGATWNPPREAWGAAAAESLGLTVTWMEGADSLAMRLGGDSRPAQVRLGTAAGSITVRYSAWSHEAGVEWPGSVEIADGSGWARLRVGIANVRAVAAADDDWFVPRIPAGARRLDWDGLRELLGRPREER